MDKKIVGFSLKNENFAFDIMRVIEIIRLKKITEVPTAPDFIEGVINLRGKIIPIIDLRKRFSLDTENRDKNYRIIIIELDKNQLVGVIVDEVAKVITVNEEEVMPPPPSVADVGGKYIENIVKLGEKIVVILDIEKIFSEEEQIDLRKLAEAEGGNVEESTGG